MTPYDSDSRRSYGKGVAHRDRILLWATDESGVPTVAEGLAAAQVDQAFAAEAFGAFAVGPNNELSPYPRSMSEKALASFLQDALPWLRWTDWTVEVECRRSDIE